MEYLHCNFKFSKTHNETGNNTYIIQLGLGISKGNSFSM